VTSGLEENHKWQDWNRSKSFEMNTIPFGSSLTFFPLYSSL